MQDYIARPPVAVVLNPEKICLAPGVRRISASQFSALVDAHEALEVARSQAETIVNQADQVRDQARQDGMNQGRAQARAELVSCVAALRGSVGNWVQNTEPKLVEIVQRCVRDVIKSVDTDQLVRDSIHRALSEMTTAQDIRVQVHESQVDGLRTQVEGFIDKHALRGVVRFEASMALKPGDCIVESPMGVVDLRVESQLKFVNQTLSPQ
jgi:type III secretion protein L